MHGGLEAGVDPLPVCVEVVHEETARDLAPLFHLALSPHSAHPVAAIALGILAQLHRKDRREQFFILQESVVNQIVPDWDLHSSRFASHLQELLNLQLCPPFPALFGHVNLSDLNAGQTFRPWVV